MPSQPANGNKGISITQIALGGIGIIFGIVAIIYSVHGTSAEFAKADLKGLQEKCRKTFSTFSTTTWKSIDTGACDPEEFRCPLGDREKCKTGHYCAFGKCLSCPYEAGYVGRCGDGSSVLSGANSCFARCYQAERIKADAQNTNLGTEMCAVSQKSVGCSADSVELGFAVANIIGVWSTCVGSVFIIIASIPIVTNGAFGVQNYEMLGRISGGFGVACSVVGFCGAFSCMISTIIASVISKAIADDLENQAKEQDSQRCSDECHAVLEATKSLGHHISSYYGNITIMMVIMMLLAIVYVVITGISCCNWKKRYSVKETVAPVVVPTMHVQQPVVTATVVTVVE